MADAAEAPARNSLYDTDFYAWTQEQARLLRAGRWPDLDLENLIEEVESVGASERREIRNRMVVLLSHLLKWKFQPGRRGASWQTTIREQRSILSDLVQSSPSLRRYPAENLESLHLSARLRASEETGIDITLFPETCPFTAAQALDDDFLPRQPDLYDRQGEP